MFKMKCWVNVFIAPYANCKGSAPFYLSLAYRTEKEALDALDAPRTSNIRDRYLSTMPITFRFKVDPQESCNLYYQQQNHENTSKR